MSEIRQIRPQAGYFKQLNELNAESLEPQKKEKKRGRYYKVERVISRRCKGGNVSFNRIVNLCANESFLTKHYCVYLSLA